MKYLVAVIPLLSGCAAWNAGFHDAATQATSIHEAFLWHQFGDATTIPYAGTALATIAMIAVTFIGGINLRKTVKL